MINFLPKPFLRYQARRLTKDIEWADRVLQGTEVKMIDNKLLSTKQVAKLLGLNIQTVRRYVREGKIRHVKFGNQIKIRPLALEEFIKEHEVSS